MQSYTAASAIGIGMGLPMGMAFYYTRMYQPSVIRSQLERSNWEMMKTFLSAVSIGGLCLSALYYTGNVSLSSRPLDMIMTPLGGAMLGSGMYLCGACPGTVWAQLGARVRDAEYVLLGGIAGSVFFAFIKEYLPLAGEKLFVHSDLLNTDYLPLAVPLWIGMMGFLIGLEYIQSRRENRTFNGRPLLGGAVIGLLQIPALMLIHTGLGTSSAFLTLPASILRAVGISNPTLVAFTSRPKNYWQLGFDIGIIAGSYLFSKWYPCQEQSKQEENKENKENSSKVRSGPFISFFGGFLLLMGARLADGCTSGHGLSGITHLSVSSFVAVAGMFGAGMFFAAVSPK